MTCLKASTFSKETSVYYIEEAAFATGEHDDPNSAVGMGNASTLSYGTIVVRRA
jgi:hypothetical protein